MLKCSKIPSNKDESDAKTSSGYKMVIKWDGKISWVRLLIRLSFVNVYVYVFGIWMWIVFHLSIALFFSLTCLGDPLVVRSCVNAGEHGSNVVLETIEIVCFG